MPRQYCTRAIHALTTRDISPYAVNNNIITQDDGITVNYEVILCESRYKTLWLVILFGYKVVVQIIGVFLAFKIRKVKVNSVCIDLL